jgi:hypothetical protein
MSDVNQLHNVQAELDAIAAKAREKIADWQNGDTAEQASKAAKKLAVIEYGKLLIEGRKKFLSDPAFGQWVQDSKLNAPPYDIRQERSYAMRIAELTVSSATYSSFDACSFTNPSNMMKWARETGLVTTASSSPRAPKPDPVREAVRANPRASTAELAQQTSVGARRINTVRREEHIREEGRKEALESAPPSVVPPKTVTVMQELAAVKKELTELKKKSEEERRNLMGMTMRRYDEGMVAGIKQAKREFTERIAKLEKALHDKVSDKIADKLIVRNGVAAPDAADITLHALGKAQVAQRRYVPAFSENEYILIQKCCRPEGKPSDQQTLYTNASALLNDRKKYVVKRK